MGLEVLVLAVPLLAIASYTLSVYQGLQPNFNEMQLLAASRRPASAVEIDDDIRKLLEEIGSEEIAGDLKGEDGIWQQVHPCGAAASAGSKLVFSGACVRVGQANDGSYCIQAKTPLDGSNDLPSLLQRLPPSGIVQDILQRQLWHEAIDVETDLEDVADLAGDWEFCYRDYVNSEELAGLVAATGAFSPISLAGFSKLSVDEQPASKPGELQKPVPATLRDTLMLFRVVPLKIQWSGTLSPKSGSSRAVIDWETSEAEVGWSWLSRKIDRPPAAEKLRQEPWEITALRKPEGCPKVVVLYRRNVGKLAFQALRR